MLQKYTLKQDMFLLGSPGPLRRQLALAFCELLSVNYEVLTISQDTTESDIKQRREMVNHSIQFIDQAPVRAALNVRILFHRSVRLDDAYIYLREVC